MSTGAIYGYFKSKEDIFAALIEQGIQELKELLNDHRYLTETDFNSLLQAEEINELRKLTIKEKMTFFKLLYLHRETFLLLLIDSAGTRFENFWTTIFQEDIDRCVAFYHKAKGHYPDDISKRTIELVIKNSLRGSLEIFERQEHFENAIPYLQTLMTFYWDGFIEFLESEPKAS